MENMVVKTDNQEFVNPSDEAEDALRLFLQGKFDETEIFIQERLNNTDKVKCSVPIFVHCHAIILFIKATISGTEDDRKQALDRLLEVVNISANNTPKQGWVQSITSWSKGYLRNGKDDNVSEEELCLRIIEAEATYLSGVLWFFDESMTSFFKGAFLIRKAIGKYKHCHTILQEQMVGSKHEIGAIKLGFGGFSLAISMLPPKLLRLLSILGFPSDRKAGLKAIEESLNSGGLRSSVSGMILLAYHVILPAFFSIPQEREQHIQSAERILAKLDELYPGSFFLSYYRGRLQRLKKDLTGSINWFLKLDEGLMLTPESKYFKMRHAWLYELGVSCMLDLHWEAAESYWTFLESDSVWSPAFFAYMRGLCVSMSGKSELAASQFAKVPGLLRKKISGRILAEEQYVSRKVKDYKLHTSEGVNGLQGRIGAIEFLYLWNSFPQMPQDKLKEVIHIADEAQRNALLSTGGKEKNRSLNFSWALGFSDEDGIESQDLSVVCNLIKGTAFRELGELDASNACLENIREDICHVDNDLYVFPMAAYERALLLINRFMKEVSGNAASIDLLKQAKRELGLAERFRHDYNFLWRLLGRVHAAQEAIKKLTNNQGHPISEPKVDINFEFSEKVSIIENDKAEDWTIPT